MLNLYTITIIVNGLKKNKFDTDHIVNRLLLLELVKSVNVRFTEYAGHAIVIAAEAVDSGGNCLIAVGGDGTFNEVINGADPIAHPDLIFGLIPVGTGNDFYKSLGWKFNFGQLVNSVQQKNVKYADLGELQFSKNDKRFFINVADIGFGGYATSLLDSQRKAGLGGGLSYSIAILRSFFSYSKPSVKIYIDKGISVYEGKLMMAAICNGSTFGNGLIICPEAITDDGHLDLCILGNVSIKDYIFNYFNLKKGRPILHPEVKYLRTNFIQVSYHSNPLYIEADGELIGKGIVTARIHPCKLKVWYSNGN